MAMSNKHTKVSECMRHEKCTISIYFVGNSENLARTNIIIILISRVASSTSDLSIVTGRNISQFPDGNNDEVCNNDL